MRTFSAVLLSAIVVFVVGCASTVKFNVRDRATGMPVNNYSVTVDNQTYTAGQTAKLDRAVWKKYVATVEADGYETAEHPVKKEIIPEFLIGGIIFWPAWGWCYGPSDVQDIYLTTPYSSGQQQMSNVPPYTPSQHQVSNQQQTPNYHQVSNQQQTPNPQASMSGEYSYNSPAI